jgi:hypothetical protein
MTKHLFSFKLTFSCHLFPLLVARSLRCCCCWLICTRTRTDLVVQVLQILPQAMTPHLQFLIRDAGDDVHVSFLEFISLRAHHPLAASDLLVQVQQ